MTIYANTIPVMIHNMRALGQVLKKAEQHCDAKKIDKSVMLGLRLAPDMFNFTRQVQLVTDFAKGCGARLSGTANPSYADDETTFDGLQARLEKCVAFLESINASEFSGSETRDVTVKAGGKEVTMKGQQYVNTYAFPHFYFHITTAYNILRHNGVELSKRDFLGVA